MDLTRGGITPPYAAVRRSHDRGQPAPAVLQHRRHPHCGPGAGASALAPVGFSFTLMTFLTSVLLGLCMGSGSVVHALRRGAGGGAEAVPLRLLCVYRRCGGAAQRGSAALLEPVMTPLRIPPGPGTRHGPTCGWCCWAPASPSSITTSPACCARWATPWPRWPFWPCPPSSTSGWISGLSWDWAGVAGAAGPRCSPRGCPPPVSPSTAGGGCPAPAGAAALQGVPGSWGAS